MLTRFRVFLAVLVVMLLAAVGCERASETPPPDEMATVLSNVREGYNAEDAGLFCADFDEVMFPEGYTQDTYLETIQQLQAQLGEWRSEVYLGTEDNQYTWRVTFANAKAKLLLVMDEEWHVTGLWFR